MGRVLHPVYLPFSKDELLSHFAEVKYKGKCVRNEKHLESYIESVRRYKKFCERNADRSNLSLEEMKFPCQIEKDERFWTASCMMTIYYSENRNKELIQLFKKAYGETPPVEGLSSWEECLDGELKLFFETKLPSPKSYKAWLKENLLQRQFIPYILDSAKDKKNLEGPTTFDAILINPKNGFTVLIEAKVLSDISCDITYDTMRNQMARNIDVMLEKNEELCEPLNKREPEKSLYLLITPKLFKDNPSSRFYGYKFNEYKSNPDSIGRDLPHRKGYDWGKISRRLGWLTWEDFKEINKACCPWLL